ncbi:hypothetical protein ARMGADRAFT_756540 [Armillaria gallica]|uniref:Uncharacterized protein n=1 Tax=Armillaria gallica TaxID=47427 RepID=A0A2H3DX34_ARMGA|nr:hypothetical protein ARMGADRAFT_756540 [Armillaria gallica]
MLFSLVITVPTQYHPLINASTSVLPTWSPDDLSPGGEFHWDSQCNLCLPICRKNFHRSHKSQSYPSVRQVTSLLHKAALGETAETLAILGAGARGSVRR